MFVSSDTYPGSGGVLGLTRARVADAKAKGVKPAGGAGFAYLRGPDDALVEYQGNMPAERFNHIHMYQEQPFCAQLWYQTHLNVAVAGAARRPGRSRTEANCRVERGPDKTLPALDWDGMFRTPAVQTTIFGDVSLYFYMNQGSTPAGPTRGHLMDHFARQRRRSRCVDREAEGRERHVPRAALHDRRTARGHDRRPEQGSDRDRRSEVAPCENVACPGPSSLKVVRRGCRTGSAIMRVVW